MVVPVGVQFQPYAQEVAKILWDAGLFAYADLSDETLPKKIVSFFSSFLRGKLIGGVLVTIA